MKGKRMKHNFFTSESVTEGHPDKICDQISDAILDDIIENDPMGRVACETVTTTGLVAVMGEVSTSYSYDVPTIVRNVIKDIGYDNAEYGFDYHTCAVITALDKQSGDIALGVDHSVENKDGAKDANDELGAGDQGMMFGYACNETPELMPLTLSLAHILTRRLTEVRKTGVLSYLRPDGKSQVTVEFEDDKPKRIDSVVISSQHDPNIDMEQLREDIKREVIIPILPDDMVDGNTKFYINPTGRFCIGGPQGDTGLTGRKIIVDTYGGYARHGGGAFSGKDPTKVDRSAAYAARYAAKNVVAAGLADKCEIQLAYAIGVSTPVSIMVDSFGTGKYEDELIAEAVKNSFDFRPAAIIADLDLRRPIYRQLAAYGHMGREDLDVQWEKTDKVKDLLTWIKNALSTDSK